MSCFYLTVRRPGGDLPLYLDYTENKQDREVLRNLAEQSEVIRLITPKTGLHVIAFFETGTRDHGMSYLISTTGKYPDLTRQEIATLIEQAKIHFRHEPTP